MALMVVACETMGDAGRQTDDASLATSIWKPLPGISGMSPIDGTSYLTLHDSKGFRPDAPRLGVLTLDPEDEDYSYELVNLDVPKDGPTSDLESGCKLTRHNGEYLISESGTWEMTAGRIYHIRLDGLSAKLLHEDKVPFTRDNDPRGDFGDQYEGLACFPGPGSAYIVLLGERGGTEFTPGGIIKVGTYNADTRTLVWTGTQIPVRAPSAFAGKDVRSITGLTIDSDNRLWASASVDAASELGPFRSVVYQIGRVQPSVTQPVIVSVGRNAYTLDGLKIEAVTAGLNGIGLSVGSEDESFGGNWRQLPLKSPQ